LTFLPLSAIIKREKRLKCPLTGKFKDKNKWKQLPLSVYSFFHDEDIEQDLKSVCSPQSRTNKLNEHRSSLTRSGQDLNLCQASNCQNMQVSVEKKSAMSSKYLKNKQGTSLNVFYPIEITPEDNMKVSNSINADSALNTQKRPRAGKRSIASPVDRPTRKSKHNRKISYKANTHKRIIDCLKDINQQAKSGGGIWN